MINAAGLADAVSGDSGALAGANAMLPVIVVEACRLASVARLVHVSSAAVQGRREVLDESDAYDGFSPYARSKILGERAVLENEWDGGVVYRPTSVHGADRAVSQTLARLARSPASSVAGDGAAPTPQILVSSVGSAVTFLVSAPHPPRIAMHPWEGITTGLLLECLGAGRRPRNIPTAVARQAIMLAMAAATVRPGAHGVARRLEMLWFGQAQERSWLDSAGWQAEASLKDWRRLGALLAQASNA